MKDWSTCAITVLLLVTVLMIRGPALPSQAAHADTATVLPVAEQVAPTATPTPTLDDLGRIYE